MQSIIEVFRMNELSAETRKNIIVELGRAINDQYGMNITGDLVKELVLALELLNK